MSGSMNKGQIVKIGVIVACLVGAVVFLFREQLFPPPPPPPVEQPELSPEDQEAIQQYQEEEENLTPAGA